MQEPETQNNAIVKTPPAEGATAGALALMTGDLSGLSTAERLEHYRDVCHSLGLNPLTKPFGYLEMKAGDDKKKLILYALKDCTDQLRSIRKITITIVSQTIEDGILTVVARATMPDGRSDEDIGCVDVGGKRGEALSNAKMKAVTKAKRRVTLSIVGLSMPDESEIESIADAKAVDMHAVPEVTTRAVAASAAGSPEHSPGSMAVDPNEETMKLYEQRFAAVKAWDGDDGLEALKQEVTEQPFMKIRGCYDRMLAALRGASKRIGPKPQQPAQQQERDPGQEG